MIELYITRHGETDYNKENRYLGRMDIALNQNGISQAKQLAEKVADFNIQAILCSPLKRAVETAKIIKAKNNCEIIIDDYFIERSVGVYEGLTKNEAKIKYPALYAKNITRIFDEAPSNGETINNVIKRVSEGLVNIKNQNKFSRILIVTHAFVGKAINKYFNPRISEQEFFDFVLNNSEIKRYTL